MIHDYVRVDVNPIKHPLFHCPIGLEAAVVYDEWASGCDSRSRYQYILRLLRKTHGLVAFETATVQLHPSDFGNILTLTKADCRPITIDRGARWNRLASRKRRAAALGGAL